MSETIERPAGPAGKKPRFGFVIAAPVVLLLVVLGQWVGNFIGRYSMWKAFRASLLADGPSARAHLAEMGEFAWSDVATTLFLLAVIAYVVVWRREIARFFRAMHVGVTLVSFTVISVLIGVLVPQLDGVEDPEVRVPSIADIDPGVVQRYLDSPKMRADEFDGAHPSDNPILRELPREQHERLKEYRQHYDAFRWSESYFLYHVLHPYGIGMPSQSPPPNALASLDRFERVYGKEERDNRQKMMEAALSSMPKTDRIEALMKEWDPGLRRAFTVCTFLDLNRTYKSNWFAALLWLLATSVAFNTFRGSLRNSFRVEKIGYLVTHVGMMVLLLGGFLSSLLTDRGILQLFLGDAPQSEYWQHYNPAKKQQMPFGVKLDHFARKEWKALEVEFLDQPFSTRLPRYTLWPGRTIPLDYVEDANGKWIPQVEVRVVELHEHAKVGQPTVTEDTSNAEPLPVVELEVPLLERDRLMAERAGMVVPTGGTRRVFLSPLLRSQGYFDPDRAYRLVAAFEQDPIALFPDESEGVLGTLYVEVTSSGHGQPIAVPVRIGETTDLPGGFKVKVVDASSDFQRRRDDADGSHADVPLAQQPDRLCAVWLDIQPPPASDGTPRRAERRIVHELINAVEMGEQEHYENPSVVTNLQWDRWRSPGPPRFVVWWDKTGRVELVDQQGTRTPVTLGQPLALPGKNVVSTQRVFQRAKFEKRLQFEPARVRDDGWDESFYSNDARGVVLHVVHFPGTDKEQVERVEMASTDTQFANRWISGDDRFQLRFLENTEGFPYDWRSVLSIVETGPDGKPQVVATGSEKEREIRVNDYFKHGNYRFFQTNADPEQPTYSGIGVVYDPGIPVVLAGMYIVILGTVLAFIVRPIVLARRRKEAMA